MRKITEASYKQDPHFAEVARAVSEILATGNVVTPVDVLIRTGRLTRKQYEDWRFGRIPYLERVASGNLEKLGRVLRILDKHARAIGLSPSHTAYHKWGRGGKRMILRFSKSGDPHLEAAYSRHYVAQTRPVAFADPATPESIQ